MSTAYKIERNTGMPAAPTPRPRKYPFPDLRVGDSFTAAREIYGAVTSAAYRFGRAYGSRFATRLDGATRIRVTRTA